MKKPTRTPVDIERQFNINEMFFSTTDEKGIITSGNDVFIRVSGFSKEELLGAPHNIIRHPDIPRAVFKLLWDFLLSRRTIAAYVKNMANDGAYYWVLALAMPIPGGFLSVRFKPSSPFLKVTADLYKKLLKTEQSFGDDWKAGMKASTEELAAALETLGFHSYEQFMRTVLQEELKSRDGLLEQQGLSIVPPLPVSYESHLNGAGEAVGSFTAIYKNSKDIHERLNNLFVQLDGYVNVNQQLKEKSQFVLQLTEGFRFISLNTSVRSAKLGGMGASLSVIADYMQNASRTIAQVISELNKRIQLTSDVLRTIIFSVAEAKLQSEMVMIFCADILSRLLEKDKKVSKEDLGEIKATIRNLQEGLRQAVHSSLESLSDLQNQIGGLDETSEELNKTVISLQFVQLGGLVEACRLDEEKGFGVIFSEVRTQLDKAKDELKDLGMITQRLHNLIADKASIDSIFGHAISHNDKHIEAMQ